MIAHIRDNRVRHFDWLTKPDPIGQEGPKVPKSTPTSVWGRAQRISKLVSLIRFAQCPSSDNESRQGYLGGTRKGSAGQSNLSGPVGLTYENAWAGVLLAPLLLQGSYIHEV